MTLELRARLDGSRPGGVQLLGKDVPLAGQVCQGGLAWLRPWNQGPVPRRHWPGRKRVREPQRFQRGPSRAR